MKYKHNKKIVPYAKELRKNMTKEEKHLWYDYLREFPVRFIRQKVIGKYIVDFYCAKAKLVIELDGSQHYEDKEMEKDTLRTEFLEQYGLKVVRISNNDVNKNFEGVCKFIDNEVKQSLSRCTTAPFAQGSLGIGRPCPPGSCPVCIPAPFPVGNDLRVVP